MKKKQFNSKLNLKKHKVSNLQQHNVQGGGDTTATITYAIITTVKIYTEWVTTPRVCVTTVTVPITLTIITDEC
jgi:hypothetical protein